MPKLTSLVLGIIISIILIIFSEKSLIVKSRSLLQKAIIPASTVVYNSTNKSNTISSTLKTIKDIARENSKLQTENQQLKAKVAILEETQKRLDILEKEINITGLSTNYKYIGGAVVSRNPSLFHSIITIDKGKRDGVENKLPVIANGFLVGKVINVYEQTSQVELITSHRFRTPVILQDSRLLGLLRGGLKGLVVEQLPVDGEIKKSEIILTSGIAGEFPPGIPIGEVGEVISKSADIFQSISVKSSIALGKIEIVFIMKNND